MNLRAATRTQSGGKPEAFGCFEDLGTSRRRVRCADFCNFCREVSVIASFTFDTQFGNCGIGRGESKPGSGSVDCNN